MNMGNLPLISSKKTNLSLNSSLKQTLELVGHSWVTADQCKILGHLGLSHFVLDNVAIVTHDLVQSDW
jgi:hypothetical protein